MQNTAYPVEDVITAAGGLSAVARHFGINRASVHSWKRFSRIPASRVIGLEGLSGISRHVLRPDIYPPESTVGGTDYARLRAASSPE